MNEKITLTPQDILQIQLEIERRNIDIVRDYIYENIAQELAVVKLNLSNLLTIDPDNPKLMQTKESATKIINDLRVLTRMLYNKEVANLGFPETITQEIEMLQKRWHITISLQKKGEAYTLSTEQEIVLFRMVQESLHNAIKHSEAKNINVTINYDLTQFSLTVTDNGNGFNPELLDATQKGVGLKSMQNRASLIGASFTIDSTIGKGTTIMVILPLDNTKPQN